MIYFQACKIKQAWKLNALDQTKSAQLEAQILNIQKKLKIIYTFLYLAYLILVLLPKTSSKYLSLNSIKLSENIL